MNISADYDQQRYVRQSSQVDSENGQQRIHHKRHAHNTDPAAQLSQAADNTAGGAAAGKSPLDSLVEAGTITADQEKAIKDAFEASRMAYQTQAGAANAAGAFKNPLDSLVSNGTITEDQENAIKSAFDSVKKARPMPPPPQLQPGGNIDPVSDALDNLVTSGTITEDQENAIKSAFESAIKAYKNQSYSNVYTKSQGDFDAGI